LKKGRKIHKAAEETKPIMEVGQVLKMMKGQIK
jgi:hypothetical protein